MARAAHGAVTDVAQIAQSQGRQAISQAGFGASWQKALRYRVYPDRPSLRSAALVYLRIPYAAIFETGGTIGGRPLLWLPTDNVPRTGPGRRMTPRNLSRTGVRLYSVRAAGRHPMLVGRRRGESRSTVYYIGLPQVNIPKRLNLLPALADAARRLPALYQARMG